MGGIDAVARPQHTGEHRCWPCTAVNLGVVAVAALILGRRRRGVGLAVAAAGVALIALRGYVVPYTPAFAPRLVERLGCGDYFDHGPAPGVTTPDTSTDASMSAPASPDGEGTVAAAADAPTGEELLSLLVERGIVEVVQRAEPGGDDVVVEPATFDAWTAEMRDLARLDTTALAAAASEVAGLDARARTSSGERETGGREYVVLGGSWLSRPVAVAEVAAARVVADRFDDRGTRLAAASALRLFLTDCPDCGATLEESSTASCCGGYTAPTREPEDVLACPECGVWVYRFADD